VHKVEFKPAVPACKWPDSVHALHHVAIRFGSV